MNYCCLTKVCREVIQKSDVENWGKVFSPPQLILNEDLIR